MTTSRQEGVYNTNVGVLGHVDSGKTSLSRALSTQSSTAAFDKSPQSQERGITLDLGFSAFYADVPKGKGWEDHKIEQLQYTLVDCPGHASLIKTIIGGAQIIDMMVLVIDVNKGIQTQTAECIVIGEMLATNLIVVLNKCDLISGDKDVYLAKMKKKLTAVFAATKFGTPQFVCTSAAPGASDKQPAQGLDDFRSVLLENTPLPKPATEDEKSFMMYVDHCFAIEGQGTILTGTILEGRVSTGQAVHFPAMKIDRKVKSIQMFRKPVKSARKGDRIGMSVSKFESSMERGIVCAVGGDVRTYTMGIAKIERVRFYKSSISSNSKLHITVGHATVMGVVKFFESPIEDEKDSKKGVFNFDTDHTWLEELPEDNPKNREKFKNKPPTALYALIRFEQPLTTPLGATMIASKLDTDVHASTCRLCFHGTMDCALKEEEIVKIKALKDKCRPATIDRVLDDYSVIGKNLVKAKGGDVTRFIGMKILFEPPRDPETDQFPEGRSPFVGIVDSTFGKSGKFKIIFKNPVFRKDEKGQPTNPKYKLFLRFRVNHFDKAKPMLQHYI